MIQFIMEPPNISEAEWTVMEALWESSPLTASEVARTLRPATGWAVNTVRTMLARLVEKGALNSEENASGVREFSPLFSRETLVQAESRTFLDRVFKGAAQPLLVHFASSSNLTPEEVRHLKKLLDKTLDSKP